jgi:Tfp pilus assembly protein PilF
MSLRAEVGLRKPLGAEAAAPAQAQREEQRAVLLGRAYLEFEHGNFTNAAAIARYLAKVHDSSEAKKILATAAHASGDNETASAMYPAALEAFPTDLNLIVGFAELCLDHSRFNEAAAQLRRAIELDPDSAHPAGAKARLLVVKTQRLAH